MPKVLLINPVSQNMGLERFFQIPPLSLMQVASLFPENYEIEFWDEVHKPFDFKNSYDLVCITSMTQQAKRAYKIASFFKENKTKVILGGMHPSVLPEEAIKYCDSVVIGEAESIFKDILNDFEEGELKKFYQAPISDGNKLNIPLPNRKILKGKKYLTKNVIQTTRGCPFKCNFCTVTNFFGNKFRQKDINEVLKEIDLLEGKFIVFLDDDLFANINYSKKLIDGLKLRDKKWVSQATLKFSEDKNFLKTLRISGCLGLFIGIESAPFIKQANFKKNERLKSIEDSLKALQDEGILVEGSFVFGFDEEDERVFERTVEFVLKMCLPSATYNILTPYPGTEIYEKFKKEGRILTYDWEKYDHNNVVFLPKKMSPEKLYDGWRWARKETYKLKSIFKRILKNKHKIKNFAYNIFRKLPNDRL